MKRLIISCVCLVLVLANPAIGQESEFVSLFNGQNLDGWYGIESMDPRKVAELLPEDFESLKSKSTGPTEAHWKVEDGEIVNDGKGPFLTTEKEFGDYELELEYKTVAKADSGVYLKGTPQVQIWDFTKEGGKWNIGADKGSGGLWEQFRWCRWKRSTGSC